MPRKGSDFERDVCRRLSLWWTGGDRDDCFWRTSTSGGRATARAKKGKQTRNHHGDISATDAGGQPLVDLLTFELKRGYNRATLHDLLDRTERAARQTWEGWIEKAEEVHKRAGSLSWAIIAKRDQREPVMVFPYKLLGEFHRAGALSEEPPILHISLEGAEIVAIPLRSFFDQVNPHHIPTMFKEAGRKNRR